MAELCELSARDMLAGYRAGTLCPVEVMQAVLDRSRSVESVLNPFCCIDAENALASASVSRDIWKKGLPTRPLEGVPVSIKDTAMVRGWRYARGSRVAENSPPATMDSPSVERLRQAGAVLFASTTTCEGGWKAVTDSPLTGITRNPHNTDFTPGGSSGGAGASIAVGCGPLALGSDGGGSIRVPSSFSGIFGLKPTFARVPMYPVGAHYTDMSHFGPMTRNVADAALMLSVMQGRHPLDPFSLDALPADSFPITALPLSGLRIGVSEDFGFMAVDEEIRTIFRTVVDRLAKAGADIVPLEPMEDWRPTYRTLWQVGAYEAQRHYTPEQRALVDQEFRAWGDYGKSIAMGDYADAVLKRITYRQICARVHDTVDFVLSPTVSVLPLKAGATVPDEKYADWLEWAGFSLLHNMTGQPASSVPAGYSTTGLPVGVQVAGKMRDDIGVLRLSMSIEALMSQDIKSASHVYKNMS
ncbi:acylamidase [Komagataeibacter europaeus]|uniref:Acylamidase n=1 Tax=Komagataeibacter europaeus TaxID=33995 RepID=A0A0M0ECU6_KOMEU|nr:amidase family protein [Komagataeibacter europaeus]KON63087.1 acylamidase [Komagataeibacter europaeus]